jgi:hypothetical protein
VGDGLGDDHRWDEQFSFVLLFDALGATFAGGAGGGDGAYGTDLQGIDCKLGTLW